MGVRSVGLKEKIITNFDGAYSNYRFKKSGFIIYSDDQFDYEFHSFIYKTSLTKEDDTRFPTIFVIKTLHFSLRP